MSGHEEGYAPTLHKCDKCGNQVEAHIQREGEHYHRLVLEKHLDGNKTLSCIRKNCEHNHPCYDKMKLNKKQAKLFAEMQENEENPLWVARVGGALDINYDDAARKHIEEMTRKGPKYGIYRVGHKEENAQEKEKRLRESRLRMATLLNGNKAVGLGIATHPDSRNLGSEYGPPLKDYKKRQKKDLKVGKKKNFYPIK